MKREETKHIGDHLKQFLDSYGLTEGVKTVDIYNALDNVIGAINSRYVTKREFFNGKLYCTISSSVVKTTLTHSRNSIVKSINENLGEQRVKEIIFR